MSCASPQVRWVRWVTTGALSNGRCCVRRCCPPSNLSYRNSTIIDRGKRIPCRKKQQPQFICLCQSNIFESDTYDWICWSTEMISSIARIAKQEHFFSNSNSWNSIYAKTNIGSGHWNDLVTSSYSENIRLYKYYKDYDWLSCIIFISIPSFHLPV